MHELPEVSIKEAMMLATSFVLRAASRASSAVKVAVQAAQRNGLSEDAAVAMVAAFENVTLAASMARRLAYAVPTLDFNHNVLLQAAHISAAEAVLAAYKAILAAQPDTPAKPQPDHVVLDEAKRQMAKEAQYMLRFGAYNKRAVAKVRKQQEMSRRFAKGGTPQPDTASKE